MGTKRGEGFFGVDELAGLHLSEALSDRVVKLPPLFLVEVVTAIGQHLVDGHELDDLTLVLGHLLFPPRFPYIAASCRALSANSLRSATGFLTSRSGP